MFFYLVFALLLPLQEVRRIPAMFAVFAVILILAVWPMLSMVATALETMR